MSSLSQAEIEELTIEQMLSARKCKSCKCVGIRCTAIPGGFEYKRCPDCDGDGWLYCQAGKELD